jgi:hypothetical protein
VCSRSHHRGANPASAAERPSKTSIVPVNCRPSGLVNVEETKIHGTIFRRGYAWVVRLACARLAVDLERAGGGMSSGRVKHGAAFVNRLERGGFREKNGEDEQWMRGS